MKILTSLLSRQKKPTQDDATSSSSSGVASRSNLSSHQTYIPAASYANSSDAKPSYATSTSATATATATTSVSGVASEAVASAPTASTSAVAAELETSAQAASSATSTASEVSSSASAESTSASASSDSPASASSSRTAAAMARASAAAARLSAASRADSDSDTATTDTAGDTSSEHSSRGRGHAYLASLIASNAASANAASSTEAAPADRAARDSEANSVSAASAERIAVSQSPSSEAHSGLVGTELHSRFERSSNFAPRANDSLKDLSEVASNRNRGAVYRAAQHMAMINQRSQEASVDESTETTTVAAQSKAITTSEVGHTESTTSTSSSSAVTASNSGVTASSTSNERNQSRSSSNSQSNDESSGSRISSVSSTVSGSSSSLSSGSMALSGSSSDYDSAASSSEEAVTSESAETDTKATAVHSANACHEASSATESNHANHETSSATESTPDRHEKSSATESTPARHDNSSATESNHATQAANITSSDPESVVQITSEHQSTSEVHSSTTATDTTDVPVVSSSDASEATASSSSNEVAKPKHRMTLRKQIKRIRPTEDNQDCTESTASKSTATAAEVTAHAGDNLGNSTTASMATATASISNVATSASTANATKHDVATADTVVSNDDDSLEASSDADLVVIPDDRQRARDDRAVVEQLLSEYKIERLTDWDSDVEPAVAGDKVIKVACNIEQAVRICGHNDSDCRNNLSHIDSYVRLCEDRFLGRRYAKNAYFAINNTFEVEESYLGDTFNYSERKEHTILELLQVLAYQDANDPFVSSAINEYGQVNYESHSRFRLRRILFNNPFLNSISYNGNLNDNDCWNTWVEQYNTLNADDTNGLIGPTTIAKFKEHFGNFANFEKAINLMRSWLIDYDSKRQWTTMFLFPFGANALYKEIDKKLTSNTNIFSGQGDVVFSMLQRASKSPYLTATQAQQLLSRDDLLEIIRNAEVSPSATAAQTHTAETSSQDAAATSAASTVVSDARAAASATTDAVSDARSAASAASTNTSLSTAMAAAKAFNAEKLDVGKELVHRFFNDDDVINIFAGFINDSELETADHSGFSTKYKTSFLPYIDLPVFERLKEDFTNLLYCPLNKQKLFIALARMATLNLLVYLLEQEQKMCICYDYSKKSLHSGGIAAQSPASATADAAAATATDDAVAGAADEVERAMAELAGRYDITMPVCAKGNKDNKDVKRISKERQLFNNGLFDDSRKSFVLHRAELYLQLTVPFLRHKPQLSTEEGNLVKRIICAAFNYNSENEDKSKKKGSTRKKLEWDMRNCSTIIETMLAKALNRETHMSGLNSHLAAQCGLSKPTKTGKANYEMSDELLRTLVMAVLGKEECMKLSRFLDIIRERYHIVIGPTESNRHQSREELENSTDRPNFEANLTQLKLQLHRLDMLINLSDYCEYIRRP